MVPRLAVNPLLVFLLELTSELATKDKVLGLAQGLGILGFGDLEFARVDIRLLRLGSGLSLDAEKASRAISR